MSVYVISDLHLSNGNADKSMEVFGPRWKDYTRRIENNWRALITPEDHIVVPGDISWGLTLEDAIPDLKFLDSLPGHKIIGKGNHDFWWQTLAKINRTFESNGITTIDILYNNSMVADNMIVCGTRGWYNGDRSVALNDTDNQKIVNREVIRLRLSLQSAVRLQQQNGLPVVVFMHFPPAFGEFVCREIMDLLHEFDVERCFFGHIHGNIDAPGNFSFENVRFTLVSSDHLGFTPIPVFL